MITDKLSYFFSELKNSFLPTNKFVKIDNFELEGDLVFVLYHFRNNCSVDKMELEQFNTTFSKYLVSSADARLLQKYMTLKSIEQRFIAHESSSVCARFKNYLSREISSERTI